MQGFYTDATSQAFEQKPRALAIVGILLLVAIVVWVNVSNGTSTSLSLSGNPPANRLSSANVQRALDQLVNGCNCRTSGSVSVIGVRETGGGNAVVDVSFQNFTDSIDFMGSSPFNGTGEAEIVHYTDGRTVLSKVTWKFGRYISGAVGL